MLWFGGWSCCRRRPKSGDRAQSPCSQLGASEARPRSSGTFTAAARVAPLQLTWLYALQSGTSCPRVLQSCASTQHCAADSLLGMNIQVWQFHGISDVLSDGASPLKTSGRAPSTGAYCLFVRTPKLSITAPYTRRQLRNCLRRHRRMRPQSLPKMTTPAPS
jgi:hypothetical protein